MDSARIVRLASSWLLPDGTLLPLIGGADGDTIGEEPSALDALADAIAAEDFETATLDQLRGYEQQLIDVLRGYQEIPGEQRTDQMLEDARKIADEGGLLDVVRSRIVDAEAVAQEMDQKFADLIERAQIAPPVDDEVDEPGPVSDDAPVPVPEPEPVGAAAAAVEVVPAVVVPAVVAAAPRRLPPTPRPAVAARGAERLAINPRVSMVAGAGGNVSRQAPSTAADLFDALIETHRSLGAVQYEAKVPVVRAEWQLPADRTLTASASAAQNGQVLERHLGFDAVTNRSRSLTAAAGICGPLAVDYNIPVIGSTARPIRDALPTVGADRGGIRWTPSPLLSSVDVTDFSAVWTEADDDADPLVPKICGVIDCLADTTATVEAVYRCIELTNFQERFSRDQADAVMMLIDTAFARWSENRLLTAIDAASVAVTQAEVISATRDLLNALEVAAVRYRRRHRAPDLPLEFIAPDYLRNVVRVDLRKTMAAGETAENFDRALGDLDGWIRSMNIRPIWHLDGLDAANAMTAADVGSTALDQWPTTQVGYLHPEGTFALLDGGRMDLGVVRDSTLNAANRLRIFSEEWYKLVKRSSIEALKITFSLDPDGGVSGTKTPA